MIKEVVYLIRFGKGPHYNVLKTHISDKSTTIKVKILFILSNYQKARRGLRKLNFVIVSLSNPKQVSGLISPTYSSQPNAASYILAYSYALFLSLHIFMVKGSNF